MMQEWMGDANQATKMEEMMSEWGKNWDNQMQMQNLGPTDAPPTIAFQMMNPYMAQTSEQNLDTRDNLSIAKSLIEQGKI